MRVLTFFPVECAAVNRGTMLNSSLHLTKFVWRQRWLLFVTLIFAGTLLVASQYFNETPVLEPVPPPIRNSHSDDFATEIYDEVYRRWYNFSTENKWYNNEHLSMFDPDLTTEIRDTWMVKKSHLSASYTLEKPEVRDPSMGQARAIMDIFQNKTNGFFIECGAYDGETRSNTLVLERFLGWSGILIEADPINFTKMLAKNRKAHMSPTCLSIKPHPMNVSFLMARNIGRIHEPDNTATTEFQAYGRDVAHSGKHVTVQCFPLVSYIAALGVETVDYFSLDVEGSEMEVLQTIPFDRVDIKTLSVEYIHGKRDRQYMIDFMAKWGYYVYSFVEHPDNLANDVIFVKKGS